MTDFNRLKSSASVILSLMVIAGTLMVGYSNQSFADGSDVTQCASSFTREVSSPFNAENFLTIDSLRGSSNVEFDYAKAVGDDGITSYVKSSSFDPSNVIFTEGETMSMVIVNHGGFFAGNIITLYHKDVPDCDILFNQPNIPPSKKIALQVLSISEESPSTDRFVIKAVVPDKALAGTDFTKLVIVYDDSEESAVWYTMPNVKIIATEARDCINLFNGTRSSPVFADYSIKISAMQGTYNVDFDYSRIFDDGDIGDGWAYYVNPFAEDNQATFVGGETVSFLIKSNQQGGTSESDDVATLYAADISDCDILYNSDSIPSSKKKQLDSTAVTDLGNGYYLHKVLIPKKDAIAESLNKLFIYYGDNDESNVYYSLPRVKIIAQADTTPPTISAPARVTLLATNSQTNLCKNLPPSAVTGSGTDGNVPSNAIDNKLSTRWSNLGIGSYITLDLGSKKVICNVDIAWHAGNARTNNFVVSVSDDGTTFKPVFIGKSSGTTLQEERYEFADSVGRYLRITVNGNSANNWASITELDAHGYTSLGFPTVSDDKDKSPLLSNNAPATGFKLGTTTVTWTAKDASGNSASATQQVVSEDKTRPAMAFSSPSNGATINGPAGGVLVQIKGTASDLGLGVQKVEVRTKDPDGLLSSYAMTTPKSTNDWSSWSTSKTLTKSGTYSIYGRVTDNAGNQNWYSISVKIAFGPDTVIPNVFISSPQSGASFSGPLGSPVKVNLAGTAADSGSGVQKVELKSLKSGVLVHGYQQASTSNNWAKWSKTLSFSQAGTYTITARVTDNAGNQNWHSITVNISLR